MVRGQLRALAVLGKKGDAILRKRCLRPFDSQPTFSTESYACLVAAAVFKTVEASHGAWWVRFLHFPPNATLACQGGVWLLAREEKAPKGQRRGGERVCDFGVRSLAIALE